MEVIIASFLMLFAFSAASFLFDAAIRWESESGNLRRAAMVADKKMEELRRLSANVPADSNFRVVLQGMTGPSTDAAAPGFEIDVAILNNTHLPVPSSGLTPLPGVHSPCSGMFTQVPGPGDNPPDDNPQLNNTYNTFPYTRHLAGSLQEVQVSVTYAEGRKTYRLVSLLGDPITPFAATPTVQVTLESGPTTFNDFTTSAVYSAQVVTSTGSKPEDVTVLWGVTLNSTGSLRFLPLDSSGRRVRVWRRSTTPLGVAAQARLQALVRYGGREGVGASAPIALP